MRHPFFRAVAGAGLLLLAGAAGASDISVRSGNGPAHVFTDAEVTVSGNRESVNFSGDGGGQWLSGSFSAPVGQTLHRGVFRDAERDSFKTGLAPGVDFGYNGGGCNELWGDFTIRQIAHDVDGNLTMLDATVNGACDEGGTPLTMTIRYKAKAFQYVYTMTPVTFPGLPVTKKFLGHTSTMGVSGTRAEIDYGVSGERQEYFVRMRAPTLTPFTVGTYQTAGDWPSGDEAGLMVLGPGYSCDSSDGTLTIVAIRTDKAGNVLGLNANFTVRCGSYSYTGTIRQLL